MLSQRIIASPRRIFTPFMLYYCIPIRLVITSSKEYFPFNFYKYPSNNLNKQLKEIYKKQFLNLLNYFLNLDVDFISKFYNNFIKKQFIKINKKKNTQ